MSINKYLREPHREDCQCSVCWVNAQPLAKPVPVCSNCRPRGLPELVNGLWLVVPAFKCPRHEPAKRLPKYWDVVENHGKPVPFVPMHKAFDLE